jgi:glycine/D-amino acid oxidase-like deaminating enzyme
VGFTSVSVNVPVYLRWLEEQCLALGVVIRKAAIKALSDVIKPNTQAVVNATGLGSLTLEDVKDTKVEPIRGQIVLVRSPVKRCVMDASPHDEPTRSTYIIPRPNSDGQTICGGCYEVSNKNERKHARGRIINTMQVGSWEREPSPAMTRNILEKCLARVPELSKDGTVEGMEIIRECVGFRPSRAGGPRLEREDRNVKGRKVAYVHAYGIGPAGYQASWGMAKEAADLVGQVTLDAAPKAKL